jgi:hypothetical protein
MDRFQNRPLQLAEALIFEFVLWAKSANAPGVRERIELMPDEAQVLAAFR